MAVEFDGSDAFIATSGIPTGVPSTIAFWLSPTSVEPDFQALIYRRNASAAETWFELGGGGAVVDCFSSTSNEAIDAGTVEVGTWHKIAIVHTTTSTTIYMGALGDALDAFTGDTPPPPNTNRVVIGASSEDASTERMQARMAGLKFWNAALTEAEVEAEFSQFTPVRTSGLLRYHRFRDAATAAAAQGGGAAALTAVGAVADATDPPGIPETVAPPLVEGTGSADLGGLVAEATGQRIVNGQATADLGGLDAEATGEKDDHLEEGTGTADLGGLDAEATGQRIVNGQATADLGGLDAVAAGFGPGVVGSGVADLGGLDAIATGEPAAALGVPYLPTTLGESARLAVEIAFGADLSADPATWTWSDVTRDVRADHGISTKLGRADEASTSQPASLSLVLDNRSGDYSLGGQSRHWPHVRRGTPVRVQAKPGSGPLRVVFLGSATGWTPGWDALTGRIPVATLSAAGTLRRLEQGDAPLLSPYRRATIDTPSVVAYWPMEDGRATNQIPAVRGGRDVFFTGEPKFAANTDFICSAPILELADNGLVFTVDPYPTSVQQQVRWLMSIPEDGIPDFTVLVNIFTAGTLGRFELQYHSGGNVSLSIYNSNGSLNFESGIFAFGLNGFPKRLSLSTTNNGGGVDWFLGAVRPSDQADIGGFGDRVPSRSVTSVTGVVFAPSGGCKGVGLGHVTVQNVGTPLNEASGALQAFVGEFVSASVGQARLERVAAENRVPIVRYTDPIPITNRYDNAGPQTVAPLLEILREAEVTDQGQLWDGRDHGLAYTTRRYRERGTIALTIDAAAGQLHSTFAAVDDDQRTRNRVAAKNASGAQVTYEDTSGPLGTEVIGIYDDSVTINHGEDFMVRHYASWSVGLGTVPGYRYPSVTVSARSSPALMAAAAAVVPGDRIDITGLDDTLAAFPAGTVSLIVEGIAQELTAADWTITYQCTPFSPWGVGRAAATTGDTSALVLRGDTDGSATTAARVAGSTSLPVITPTGPRWTTADDDYPMALSVGGVRVIATGCAGTGTAQTFTIQSLPVARPAGAPVSLHDPRPLSL